MDIRVSGNQVLSGEITPSGSKNSIVCLIPATLLFNHPVTLKNVPDITDVTKLVESLSKLGSQISWDKSSRTIVVDNSHVNSDSVSKSTLGGSKGAKASVLLWGPLLARFKKAQIDELPGGCTLGARPLDAHYQAFMDLGVAVKEVNGGIFLDASRAKSASIWLLETSVTATENALMLATSLPGTTTIVNAATEPHVQDLCNFLVSAGAKITGIGSNILTIVGDQALNATTYSVISDICEIGTFLSLGALTGGKVSVQHALPEHSVIINREFSKFGIHVSYKSDTAIVAAKQHPLISKTKSPMIVRAQPWPALPVDMLPLFIPLAISSPSGQVLFHNWMYEAGLFWTSELLKLGANLTMCDPHRVLVTGGNRLSGATLEAPYIIRAVISMLMCAMMATGETTILNADAIHRGHPNFVANLRSLGAKIEVSN